MIPEAKLSASLFFCAWHGWYNWVFICTPTQ